MTTSRELIKAALDFREYDRVPIEARDASSVPFVYPVGRSNGLIGVKGKRTDIWGCGWEALEDGVCGEVKYHPLEDWDHLSRFSPPWDVLKQADLSDVNRFCASSDKFCYVAWEPAMPNIFERMQFLRGTENLFIDLAYGDARVIKLRDMLQEYYLTQMEMWIKTDIDAIHIADDWGSQNALLISPEIWREYFKPIYKQYCDMAHKMGKYVIMHSDGFVEAIIPDLIEIGVNALNLQIFCMDMEKIADLYHHKVAFWGEIDRQWIQVYGTSDDMRAAVRRLAAAFFKYGNTGFVAQCFYTMKVPEINKIAEWSEWERILR